MHKANVIPAAKAFLHRRHASAWYKTAQDLISSDGRIPSTAHFYKTHQQVFRQGDQAMHLFEVTSGVLMISKITEDGCRQVVEIAPKGWVCGFSEVGFYGATCEALSEATADAYLKADLDTVEALGDRSRLSQQIEQQICALHDHSLLLSRKSAEERVASLVMRFVPGRGVPNCAGTALGHDDAEIDVPMSGSEIGDFVGLNAETVSRAITKLEQKGLIVRAHGKRHGYRIPDICRLCKAAHNDCKLGDIS